MIDDSAIEVKPRWEFYPEIIDSNLDHPAYRLEFHSMDGVKWTWKLTQRNFIHSSETWEKINKNNGCFFMIREGHPYSLVEDEVLSDNGIPNKQWLKWMCDALNEKALKEYLIKKNNVNLNPHTFGNHPAAVNLTKVLNQEENRKYSRKINKYISKAFREFKLATSIENEEFKKITLFSITEKYRNIIVNLSLPDIIKSLTQNIIITKYRMYLKKNII